MPRSARITATAVLVGMLATLVPLVAAAPASAARAKSIRIADASVVEGDAGSKSMTFSLTWTGAKGGSSVTVAYTTVDGTATAGTDYTAKTGTASFNNGCKCATVSVPILGDKITEGTEAFAVNLSAPVNATIADGHAVGTIYDNEGPPSFVVGDATADEGAGTVGFDVVMTSATSGTQTVDFATSDGTALAGADYTATSGSLSFSGATTTQTVLVPIADDALNEADETLTLTLSNASITVADASAIGSITDNDPEPSIAVGDVSAAEDAKSLTFAVTTSAVSGQEVDVDYTTTDVSAVAGSDYTTTSGTAVIPAGATSTTVHVPLLNDTTYEGDEKLTLDLASPFNASIADGQAVGTIADDDVQPTVSIADTTVTEGNSGTAAATFTVTLSNPSAFTASAPWATSDASAIAGSDYTAASGTVTFPAGTTSQQISVDVLGDATVELDETFSVVLSAPTGAVGTPTGTATILDDDRTTTTVTLKVIATKTKVGAQGVFETATADANVTVTLYKRKHKAWVQVSAKTVAVTKLGDRDHDTKPDAAYKATFKRPTKGKYKLTSTFAGSATLLPCTKSAAFNL